MGKALRPEAVHVVSDLPRTRSGKVMRRVARAAYLGTDPGDLSALENPLAIESIRTVGRTT
jgi:acetyl-CoA synthetase